MTQARILTFAGSTRKESLNARLVGAASLRLEAAGARVTRADLKDYPMPLYNGDDEARDGLPEGAQRLKRLMREHDGFLIASPEYNSSFTPLLKNTLDWCSRREPNDPTPMVAYRGKTVAMVAASNGRFGGMRGLLHLRPLLSNLGLVVIPQQLALAHAKEVLGEDGVLGDEAQAKLLNAVAEALVRVTTALNAARQG